MGVTSTLQSKLLYNFLLILTIPQPYLTLFTYNRLLAAIPAKQMAAGSLSMSSSTVDPSVGNVSWKIPSYSATVISVLEENSLVWFSTCK